MRQHCADEDDSAAPLRRCDPRRVLPLVSKAFLEACNEADGLWRRVQLDLTRLPARDVPRLSNWLHAHAASIRVLVLYGRALSSVDAALRKHVKRLAAAVGEASGLQQLYLARPLGAELFARMDPLGLPHLRSVGVDLAVVDDDWLERQQELESHEESSESLEMMLLRGRLAADTNHSKHLQTVWHVRPTQADVQRHATSNLLRLPALSGLLVLSGLEAHKLVRDPSLPALEWLHLAELSAAPCSDMLARLASLSSLTSLRFSRHGFLLPGPLTTLSGLAHLHVSVRYKDSPVRVLPSITALRQLRALWLQHALLEEPASLAALPLLHSLALVGGEDGWPATLHALAAVTQLRALHLEAHASAVAEVPPGTWRELAALQGGGLTRLELPFNRLVDLPAGPYLSSLQVLDLSQNSLPGVPPALASSTCLRFLSLGQQESAAPGDSPTDVAILRQLPLALLITSSGHYSASHITVGLRSLAEQAHLQRVRSSLPPGLRVGNKQALFHHTAGQLASLFEVDLRQDRL
ncbi:hypothetical protein D9Q98_008433 [Chlorella vulgaris]|uniref:Uncharacterized protein n=1 Tax=Chlorella vulgaris TaxID=3077 RepID=A0A9D4TGP7_CHLVU|nr:hypothetical protein D9Q98_008433 [Chlorella vulgaris]